MKFYFKILCIVLFVFKIEAQTQLKLMSYNLLGYPSATGTDRKDELRYILNSYQPDIFMACEVEDSAGADEILDYCLGTQDYDSSYFTYNHSDSYHLQQMIYFNKHKFELVNETYLVTYIRDINHYTLKLKTATPSDALYIDVYVGHLKAGNYNNDPQVREDMVNVLINDLHNIPAGHYVIFAGDFNLYSSNEAAYQNLINPNNAVVFHDPVDRVGSWHNNINFKDIDTQSTHSTSENNFVGGGLDDRFDFILLSDNLMNSPALHYVSGSYAAYGNNGTCFNKAINSSYCQGSTYDLTLRQHLYNMSDHLPVVLRLETPITLDIEVLSSTTEFTLKEGNLIHSDLHILSGEKQQLSVMIYNTAGQLILQQKKYTVGDAVNVSGWAPGVYYLYLQTNKTQQVIKFVKTG